MSRTPTSDMCSVRGIGVAVIVSTSTVVPQRFQPLLHLDAEPLLFVDDHQAQVVKLHVLLDASRCVPIDDVDLARLQPCERLRALPCGVQNRLSLAMSNGNSAIRCAKAVIVLLGQDRRRHEHGDLIAAVDRFERRPHGDFGFAEADVAAEQPVHRPRPRACRP